MSSRASLTEAVSLLRDRPVLFLPRLVIVFLMSIVWLWIADIMQALPTVQITEIAQIGLVMLVLLPIQLLVYNFYFFVVRQHYKDQIDIRTAWEQSIDRLPRAGLLFLFMISVITLVSLPSIVLVILGIDQKLPQYLYMGGASFVLLMLIAATVLYFTPYTVITQENGFIASLKDGITQSRRHSPIVFGFTLLSFLLLGAVAVLEGQIETIGMIGFIGARLLNGIVSVYLLIINPTLFHDLQN